MAALTTKTLRPAGEGRKLDWRKDREENDRILRAAENGDIDTLVSMSNDGIDVTTFRDEKYGQTVLHKASECGQHELLNNLLKTGIAVDVRDNSQWTALHTAALNGKNDCIQLLLKAGAAVGAKTSIGSTPLHKAAVNGHNKAIDILVAARAIVDIKNDFGSTSLAIAVIGGHDETVHTLVYKYKADPSRVKQEFQQKMKDLLKKAEEKKQKLTNEEPSLHDPPQAQPSAEGAKKRQKPPINRKTVFAYQEAFKKGKRAANKFKIVVIGSEGAGKTSTIHSLLNKAFQHQQQSTIGADVNTCTANRFFTVEWKQIEIQHHLEDLPKQLTSKLKSFMLQLPKKALEQTPDKPVEKEEPCEESFPEEVISHEMAVKAQEVMDAQELHEEEIQITILDLGGQEIYYHIHFLFLAEEDVVFIAFNASEHLDQPVVCRQRLTRFQKKVKTRGMQTNLQTIETLMQSVYSHCGKVVDGKLYISNRIPTIVLIATHSKDLSDQWKAAIVVKLYEAFNGKPFMDHLPRSTKEAIFFIDNNARDPQVFEALKLVVLKAAAPIITKECPISYLQFEIDILKESQSKVVISKQEALAIAEKASLQDNLMEVLNHYTLKGTLLYYPEVESLQNEVFISPQEVSDLVSSVITTHNCEPSSAKLQQVCYRYDQFGLLEEDLLDDMLHTAGRYKDKNTILGFLEKFHLAVEVSRDTKFDKEKEAYTTPKSGRVFLVPSMLVYNPKAVPIAQKGDIILIYHFPDLFVPENVFNEVLVRIASWCHLHGHHVHSIFHGVGCFHCEGRKQSFKLLYCLRSCSIKCFITVHQHNIASDILDAMLLQRQQLRHHLEECIEEAHQSHIPCARSPVGYLECPLHAPEENCPPHVRLDQLTPFDKVCCRESFDCEVVPREAYALLFVPSLTTATEVATATQFMQGTVTSSQIEDRSAAFVGAVASNGQTYNCSDAAKLLKSKFALLSNLSYSNMSGSLYANNVITQQEKLEIDRLVGKSQMERVLDIVIASLKANQTAKYKSFLLTMESNEDGILNAKAQELGGSHSVPG